MALTLRVATGLFLAVFAFKANGARADPTDNSLQVYVVQMLQGSPQSVAGAGVYLGRGLVLTARHVAGPNHAGVRIAGLDMPAQMIKGGSFETIDLALFSMDEERLPVGIRLRRMPLCQRPLPVGAPVILAAPEGRITRSSMASPMLLSPRERLKFSTMIIDVETSGKSGSGVFDAINKCLLGILSAKITSKLTQKDIGTYFVSANVIQSFVPTGTRW